MENTILENTILVRTVNMNTWNAWKSLFESQKETHIVYQITGIWEFSIRKEGDVVFRVTRNTLNGKTILDPF